jgi:hypothetical protein
MTDEVCGAHQANCTEHFERQDNGVFWWVPAPIQVAKPQGPGPYLWT